MTKRKTMCILDEMRNKMEEMLSEDNSLRFIYYTFRDCMCDYLEGNHGCNKVTFEKVDDGYFVSFLYDPDYEPDPFTFFVVYDKEIK